MISPIILHLRVPKENPKDASAMENVFSGLAELFRRNKTNISFEIVIKEGYLYFFIVCEKDYLDLIRGQLFSQYPDLEIQEVSDYLLNLSEKTRGVALKLERPSAYPLKTYKEIKTDFLSSLSGLATSVGKNEMVIIQLLLEPINKDLMSFKAKEILGNMWRSTMRKNSSLKDLLSEKESEKLSQTLFKSSVIIASDANEKSEFLITSVLSLFKLLENPNFNSFKTGSTLRDLETFKKRVLSKNTLILNCEELATIFHMPTKISGIAQVAVSKTKTAEPPINLPTTPEVIPFATTNFRGMQKEFSIKREDRRKHLYVVGKTGVGKSKLIELLALADIKEKKGCVIMDPHGDLSEEMLRFIPRERLYDVVYFNPADTEFPMSFNPLEGVTTFEFRQNVVAGFISIFKKLFSFTWNQRLEHVLRYTTLALLDVPNATVLGIPKILSDTKYRQEVVAQIKDPLVKKFWTTEFSSWNEQYAGEAITPLINKVGQFVANPIIRNIVGQPKSTIKIDDIINNEKILIANFSLGKLGEENSALLGAMFITKLWQAAVARSAIAESERKDTFLYVDEFQNFATSAFANILSEARKYKLNLTVAHQYMTQLPEEVRSTIFGNVGSIISFRVGGEDANVLEKEFKPSFVAEDFMNLDMRNFFVKMTIDGQTATPFSGRTLDFPKPDEDLLHDVVRISRERWAKPRVEVEKQISLQEQSLGTSAPEEKPKNFTEPLI